ncbi:hypothetical protein A2115_00295 [Candidatus Woesebacteria bacterium GWA1_41_8]|uniref:O-antigen ligase-related domain-containing protein n=1 Tax=Candidatus Woesebacteria bacterium GWA1_41_8 TaxID=1802471 RepID=A0A1F7WGA7_9BACT|nr:MAG: hypothetical protein A2115_00295 [Candidatus Woesebacteria bacterium GWA1_41_8]
MDKSKILALTEKLLFGYLLLFPFGQLLALKANIFGVNLRVHPTDLIILPFIVVFISKGIFYPKFSGYLKTLGVLGAFSLALSLAFLSPERVTIGAFYFLRIVSYSALLLAVYNLVRVKVEYKRTLFLAIIVVCLEVAIFGLIQYFFLPDLRFLFFFGWDDHLYRLAGAFLDPGFTAIILATGALLALCLFLEEKSKAIFWIMTLLFISLLLTYSRAGFLAFSVGLLVIFLKTKKGVATLLGVGLLVSLFLLPRPEGYGVRLERTHSIVSRLQNYQETLLIFRKSPVFGVGFNNMCAARAKILGDSQLDSHACSGADSSLLLILATGGTVGLVLVLYFLVGVLKSLDNSIYSLGFLASLSALIVNSQFINSLIYPWVMGIMAILGGLALSKPSKGKMLP